MKLRIQSGDRSPHCKDADNHLSCNDRRLWIFTVVLLLLCTSLGSCVDKKNTGSGVTIEDQDGGGKPWSLVGFEAENPHFEVPSGTPGVPLPGIVPAYWYFLAEGDLLAPAFDTFEMHFQREDKMCDFLDNTPVSPNGADCLVCDLCGDSTSPGCKGVNFSNPGGGIEVGFLKVITSGYMGGSPMADVFDFAEYQGITRLRSACPGHNRLTFDPAMAGTLFRFGGSGNVALRGGSGGVVKTVMVNEVNDSPEVFYQLTSHYEGVQLPNPCATPAPSPSPGPVPPSCPGCAWFKLPAPTAVDGYREDSFSPKLYVTRVVVLKGTPVVDKVTGRFRLDYPTTEYVHPSRIILHPGANGDESALDPDRTRCYADSSVNGNINLKTCRTTYNMNCNTPDCLLSATPQYLHSSPTEGLTWFVEFNPAEGGIIPTLNCGEVLAIVFTLERLEP
jgi:hypothetical protein